ncbi:16025_t:CDS:2 [Cetraspora pellucida]|uniref:16025_t:CDS:1 n=1 Tax=Cetraspora pellucida TaxID=1433469 RepID=A0A9N9CZS8_9GLOM|nr:16025_t:CDS:2 [Cetraspora pellucida]
MNNNKYNTCYLKPSTLKILVLYISYLVKCVRADDKSNFTFNTDVISNAYNFLLGTFVPSALILAFIFFSKNPSYNIIVGILDDLFLYGVCFLLPLVGQWFQQGTFKTSYSIIIAMLFSAIMIVIITPILRILQSRLWGHYESKLKYKLRLVLYVAHVGFIQGVLNSISTYQTTAILAIVGFLLIRITFYVKSNLSQVGMLAYIVSEIEQVGSISCKEFVEKFKCSDNDITTSNANTENNSESEQNNDNINATSSTNSIDTNEKQKENIKINIYPYNEKENDFDLECKVKVDKLHKDKDTELHTNKFVVFSFQYKEYKFKFSIPIIKKEHPIEHFVIMAYRKPENLFKFWDARKNPIEIEINIPNNNVRVIKCRKKDRSEESITPQELEEYRVIGTLKQTKH